MGCDDLGWGRVAVLEVLVGGERGKWEGIEREREGVCQEADGRKDGRGSCHRKSVGSDLATYSSLKAVCNHPVCPELRVH